MRYPRKGHAPAVGNGKYPVIGFRPNGEVHVDGKLFARSKKVAKNAYRLSWLDGSDETFSEMSKLRQRVREEAVR